MPSGKQQQDGGELSVLVEPLTTLLICCAEELAFYLVEAVADFFRIKA